MRRRSVWLAGVAALAVASTAHGTGAGGGGEMVLQRDEEMAAAVMAADVKRLEDLYTEDYVFVGSDGRQVSRAERLDAFRSGRLRYLDTKHLDVTVRVYGPTAIVQGRARSSVVANGRPFEGDYRYVGLWVLQGDTWRIAYTQATRIAG